MQAHRHHHELVTHALAGIAQHLAHTAVALDAGIAVFNADATLRELSSERFLVRSQFIFGFAFLFAFAFDRRGDDRLTYLQPLKSTVGDQRNGTGAGEGSLIQDFLVMGTARCFLGTRQDELGSRMSHGHIFLRMSLLLPGIRLFLLRVRLWATDGPLCSIGENPQLFEFGKLFDNFFY